MNKKSMMNGKTMMKNKLKDFKEMDTDFHIGDLRM